MIYSFLTTLMEFYIGGKDRLTLSAADPTNPRLDTTIVDSTGALIIKGLAVVKPNSSNNRSRNSIRNNNYFSRFRKQHQLSILSNKSITKIEWTTTSTGSLVNFSAVNNPIKGIVNATIEQHQLDIH
jgi:hypothetical protein